MFLPGLVGNMINEVGEYMKSVRRKSFLSISLSSLVKLRSRICRIWRDRRKKTTTLIQKDYSRVIVLTLHDPNWKQSNLRNQWLVTAILKYQLCKEKGRTPRKENRFRARWEEKRQVSSGMEAPQGYPFQCQTILPSLICSSSPDRRPPFENRGTFLSRNCNKRFIGMLTKSMFPKVVHLLNYLPWIGEREKTDTLTTLNINRYIYFVSELQW